MEVGGLQSIVEYLLEVSSDCGLVFVVHGELACNLAGFLDAEDFLDSAVVFLGVCHSELVE